MTDEFEGAHWNYRPCKAEVGSAICGTVKPGWWCADLQGKRAPCIKIWDADQFGEQPFFIFHDEAGYEKVFKRGGGPDSSHSTFPVDYPATYIPGELKSGQA